MLKTTRINIYGLHDPLTGELRYIGKTKKPLQERLVGHAWEAKQPRLSHIPKNRWFAKIVASGYFPEARIIMVVPEACWQIYERLTIGFYRKLHGRRLLNVTSGGEGLSDFTHSAETREKLRRANLGKKNPPRTPEQRAAISAASKGVPKPWQIGRKASEETKAKMSATRKGRIVPAFEEFRNSPDFGQRISQARTGLPRPWQKGVPRSPETREKIKTTLLARGAAKRANGQ